MQDILEIASDLITGDRAQQHGEVIQNHRHIAEIWNGYLYDKFCDAAVPLTGADAANMMELLKIARRKAGAHNPDDYVDAAGYAAIAHECATK